ncbi:hypothetical protein [Bacteroides sp.]|uniref:hypothetical protein n=1 Tax=Bacteroides sp. TaxID=29523 RepID=UPI0025BD54B5|nr:hypothetical protein [Bacteroides sp.]
MKQKKITLEHVQRLCTNSKLGMEKLLETLEAKGLTVAEAFMLYINAMKYFSNYRFFKWESINDVVELGEEPGDEFDNLILRRYENLDELKKDIQRFGENVKSIVQVKEAEDHTGKGHINPDYHLIAEIDTGEDETYDLALYYYIDRLGQIVITQTTVLEF